MPRELQRDIELPVGLTSLLPMRDFVRRCLDEAEVPASEDRAAMAACDEALTAALIGGAEESRRGHIHLVIDINPTRLRLLLRDDTEGAEHAAGAGTGLMKDATRPSRRVNLPLLRQVMDEVRYVYRRGFQNELELIKFFFANDTAQDPRAEAPPSS